MLKWHLFVATLQATSTIKFSPPLDIRIRRSIAGGYASQIPRSETKMCDVDRGEGGGSIKGNSWINFGSETAQIARWPPCLVQSLAANISRLRGQIRAKA